MEWILVIILQVYTGSAPLATATIEGYKSKEGCEQAAAILKEQLNAKTACVPRKAEKK